MASGETRVRVSVPFVCVQRAALPADSVRERTRLSVPFAYILPCARYCR